MKIVKNVISEIVKPLCYIFNLSFQSGIFPQDMKIAKVVPLYKTGEKQSFNNYRPVSILSQFAKILEKAFVLRMDSFIEKHKLLADSQYGFRTGRSTSQALLDLVEHITERTDKNNYPVGVFLDFSKAFDTINHRLLMKKMERYGFRGLVSTWVQSYIEDRKQFVQINEISSDLMDIQCGVPQGSILGPKLFLIYK